MHFLSPGRSLRPRARQKRKRFWIGAATLSLVFSLLFSYFNFRLSPLITSAAEEEARAVIEHALNRALSESLADPQELLHYSYDERGRLTLLTCDTARVNLLRSTLSEAVLATLEESSRATVKIPLGNLLSLPLLAGRGPAFSVRIVPLSSATVTLKDDFRAAGINQTLFTLSAEITLRVRLLEPLQDPVKELSLSLPLTQIIISGDVPQVYVGA